MTPAPLTPPPQVVALRRNQLANEYVGGRWVLPGEDEPDAIVTYSEVDGPELPAGWCWCARGRVGTADSYENAKKSAERAVGGSTP